MKIKYILYYCITNTRAEAMYAYGRIFEINATNATQINATNATNATQINATSATQINATHATNQYNP